MAFDLDAWSRTKDEQEAAAKKAAPPSTPPADDEGDFDLEAWELDRARGVRRLDDQPYKKRKAAAPAPAEPPPGQPVDPALFKPGGMRADAAARGITLPEPIEQMEQDARRTREATGAVNAITATKDDLARGVESARAGVSATIGVEAEKMRQQYERTKAELPHYAAYLENNDERGAWAEAEKRAAAEVDRTLPNATPEARAYALRLQRQVEAARINQYQAAKRGAGEQGIMRDAGITAAGEFASKAAAIPKTREREEFDAAPNLAGKLIALAKNPAEVIRSLVAESTAQSAPAVALGAAGALAGGPGGAAAGAALGGSAVDYTATILGELNAAGIDMTKPEEAAAKLEANPGLLDQVRETAAKRQVPMAVINAVTGALGGRFLGKAVQDGATGRAMAGAIGKELAVGAVGEAAGEAGAQIAAGQQLDLGEVLAEGLGGLGGQVGEVAGTLARQNAQAQAANTGTVPGKYDENTGNIPGAPVAPAASLANRVAKPAAPLAGMDLESGLTTPPGEAAPVDLGAKPAPVAPANPGNTPPPSTPSTGSTPAAPGAPMSVDEYNAEYKKVSAWHGQPKDKWPDDVLESQRRIILDELAEIEVMRKEKGPDAQSSAKQYRDGELSALDAEIARRKAAVTPSTGSTPAAAAPPTVITGPDFRKMLDDNGKDMSVVSDKVVARAEEALKAGANVTLVVDGRRIGIVSVQKGMLADAKGQKWGLMSLATGRDQKNTLEISTPSPPAPQNAGGNPPVAAPGGSGESVSLTSRVLDALRATDITPGAHAKVSARIVEAVITGKFNDLLRPENKQARRIFAELTGIKLPPSLQATQALFTGKPFAVVPPGTKAKAADEAPLPSGMVRFRPIVDNKYKTGGVRDSKDSVGEEWTVARHHDMKFVVAQVRGKWGVYELSSGLAVKRGLPTKEEAIERARGILTANGPDAVKAAVKDALERYGAAGPAPTSTPTRQVIVDKAPPGGWTDADKVPANAAKPAPGATPQVPNEPGVKYVLPSFVTAGRDSTPSPAKPDDVDNNYPVRIMVPGDDGNMVRVSGKVVGDVRPDGKVRVKTQAHGEHVVPYSTLMYPAKPAASNLPPPPNGGTIPTETPNASPDQARMGDPTRVVGSPDPSGNQRPGSTPGIAGQGGASPGGTSGPQGRGGEQPGVPPPAGGQGRRGGAGAGKQRGGTAGGSVPGAPAPVEGGGAPAGGVQGGGAPAGGGPRSVVQGASGGKSGSVLDVLSAEKQARAAAAKQVILDRLKNLNSGIDPVLMQAGVELTTLYVEAGARKFAAYAREMVNTLGEQIKPYLKAFYLSARMWPDMPLDQKADMDKGDAVDEMDVDAVLRSTEAPADAAPSPTPAPGEPPPKSKTGGGRKAADKPAASEPKALPVEQQNHVIQPDDVLVVRGDKAKTRANIAAIRLLKDLEAQGRLPTPQEKRILAQYVGWGGLANGPLAEGKAFNRNTTQQAWAKEWGKEYDTLRELLDEKEWNSAIRSTENAHYTTRAVIERMWSAAQRMGFKGGKVGEFGAGIGHFAGLSPVGAQTQFTLVERDALSGRMLKMLYPQANVIAQPLEAALVPNHSLDMVIGNVPFAKDGPLDKAYPAMNLHNYFLARAIDAVKPGGLVVAISSSSSMDNPSNGVAAREWMAERADLVGAIRLPSDAFKENAGTEVVTDIIILRKRDGTPFPGQPWTAVAEESESLARRTEQENRARAQAEEEQRKYVEPDTPRLYVNEYFNRHPENVLGRLSLEGTMYGGDEGESMTVTSRPGQDTGKLLEEAIARLPENVLGEQRPQEQSDALGERSALGEGSVVVQGGRVMQVWGGTTQAPGWHPAAEDLDGYATPASRKSAVTRAANRDKRAAGYVGIRDALLDTIRLMNRAESTDAEIAAAQQRLNDLYDAHVREFSHLSAGHEFLDDDPSFGRVLALETETFRDVEKTYPSGQKYTFKEVVLTKAKIFTERTVRPVAAPASAGSVEDAASISLAYRGRLDLDYMAELTGQTREDVTAEALARGIAFEDPKTGMVVDAQDYLSGDVKTKLEEARNADPERYAANVPALEAVQPPRIPMERIRPRLGALWVPDQVITGFVEKLVGGRGAVVKVSRSRKAAMMRVDVIGPMDNEGDWSTQDVGFVDLLNHALSQTNPVVMTPGTKENPPVKDDAATAAAVDKLMEIKQAFRAYAQEAGEHHQAIEDSFNDTSNRLVERKYTPPDWKWYPGMAQDPKKVPRERQKRMVARVVQGKSVGMFHAPGTGKTMMLQMAAMELKRLGLARKTMIVTQNSANLQFVRAAAQLYPNARILAPTERQRSAVARKRILTSMATGDWDMIILPQSFFELLPNRKQTEEEYVARRLSEIRVAYIESKSSYGDSPATKAISRRMKAWERKLQKMLDRKQDDDGLTFEDLGVDALFIDEAHRYKKLEFDTYQDPVKGLDAEPSLIALGAYLKILNVHEKTGGRNVIMATGTPVTNTLGEAWNMIRYVRPDILKDNGIEHFDQFTAKFAEPKLDYESNAGGEYQAVSVLKDFNNLQLLRTIWRVAHDVVPLSSAGVDGLPRKKGGQMTMMDIQKSPNLDAYIQTLLAQLRAFAAMRGMKRYENRHIPGRVFMRGAQAAVDLRLIDPDNPNDPGSKANVAVKEIYARWKQTEGKRGTQFVFSDLQAYNPPKVKKGEPKDTRTFNLFHYMRGELIKLGVPADEIIVASDISQAEKRTAAFERLDKGEARIAFGSTSTLGTGVNAQTYAVAVHHLDCPHMPADLEQRDARAIRQLNTNEEVEVIAYGILGSLDSLKWQRLARKALFIEGLMADGVTVDEIADMSSETPDYRELAAILADDPVAMERFKLEEEVKKLENLRMADARRRHAVKGNVEMLRRIGLEVLQRGVESLDRLHAQFAAADTQERRVVINGVEHGADDAAKALQAWMEPIIEQFAKEYEGRIVPPLHGVALPDIVQINGVNLNLRARIPGNVKTGMALHEHVSIEWRVVDGTMAVSGDVKAGAGMLTSFKSKLARLEGDARAQRTLLDARMREVEEGEKFLAAPFKFEAQYQDARGRLDAIMARIKKMAADQEASRQNPNGGGTIDGDEPVAVPSPAPVGEALPPDLVERVLPQAVFDRALVEYDARLAVLGLGPARREAEALALGETAYRDDGGVYVGIDPRAREACVRLAAQNPARARQLLKSLLDEEVVHAARFIALREEWQRSGDRRGFLDFVAEKDALIWRELSGALESAGERDRQLVGDALQAVWNLYVHPASQNTDAPLPQVNTPEEAAIMMQAIQGDPRLTVSVVNEFLRMVYQKKRQGTFFEQDTRRWLDRIIGWAADQLRAIRRVITRAFSGQISPRMAQELSAIDRILAVPDTGFDPPVRLSVRASAGRMAMDAAAGLADEPVPDSKMRRFAERTAVDPDFAAEAPAIAQDPNAYYRPQSHQEIFARLQASTDQELQARVSSMQEVESEWNDGMLAGIELAKRLQEQGGDIAPLVVQMAAKGTTAAQLLRQMAEWKTVVPDLALKAIEGELRKKGRFLDDARRQRIIDLFTADRDARGVLREAEAALAAGWTDAAAARVDAAEAAARRAHWEFSKHVSSLIPMGWDDLLVTALQGNLLTPMSQSANLVGNALFLPLQFGQRTVGAALDTVHSLFRRGGGRTMAAPARLVASYFGGMAAAVPDAARALLRGQDPRGGQAGDWQRGFAPLRAIVQAWTGEGMPLTEKGKISVNDRFKKLAEFSLGVFAAPMLRLLGAGDALFSGAARNALLREQAILKGLRGGDAKVFMKIPDQQTLDLLEEEVRETVFQQSNGFVDWVMAGERRLAAGRFLGPVLRVATRIVFPYIKTPTNLAVEGLHYGIPVLSLAAAIRAAVNGDQRAAYQNVGKFVMGSTMLLAAFYLAKHGLLSGDGDEEEKKRQLQYGSLAPNTVNISALARVQAGGAGGWQPGDRVVSYTKLGFFGVVLAMVANGKARADEQDMEFEAAAVLSGQATIPRVGSAIVNMTMLKGAAGFLGALVKDDYTSFAENFANTLPSVAIPNTFAAVNRQRWTYLPELRGLGPMEKFEHALKTKLFMAHDLPIKRDLFGRGVKATPDGAAPWAYTHVDVTKARNIADDPIMKAVYDVYHATKDGEAIPSVPGRKLQVQGKEVALTDVSYDRLLQVVGEERQAAFWRMIDARPNYAAIGYPQRLSLLRNAWEAGYNRGRGRFLKEYLYGDRERGPDVPRAGALAMGATGGVGSR